MKSSFGRWDRLSTYYWIFRPYKSHTACDRKGERLQFHDPYMLCTTSLGATHWTSDWHTLNRTFDSVLLLASSFLNPLLALPHQLHWTTIPYCASDLTLLVLIRRTQFFIEQVCFLAFHTNLEPIWTCMRSMMTGSVLQRVLAIRPRWPLFAGCRPLIVELWATLSLRFHYDPMRWLRLACSANFWIRRTSNSFQRIHALLTTSTIRDQF